MPVYRVDQVTVPPISIISTNSIFVCLGRCTKCTATSGEPAAAAEGRDLPALRQVPPQIPGGGRKGNTVCPVYPVVKLYGFIHSSIKLYTYKCSTHVKHTFIYQGGFAPCVQ